MKKFLNWLVISSANPQKVSLTARGALVAIIPTLIYAGQLAGYRWSTEHLTTIIDQATTILSATLILIGLCRKFGIALKDFLKKDDTKTLL